MSAEHNTSALATATNNANPPNTNGAGVSDGVQTFTLFVGQVPNDVNEETLKHLFSAYGLVTESKILMDRVANKPKGCGFVTFADKHGAETAIATLHDKYSLPGASRPLIVRYSTKQLAADNPSGDATPVKLYISNLSKQTTEEEVRAMFSQYGELIDDVVILKDQQTGQSKGVAFVKFSKSSEANNAINSLHDQLRDKDATNLMQVKFAHTASEKKNMLHRQMAGLSMAPNGHPHMHHPNGAGAQMGGYYPAHYNPAFAQQHGFNPYLHGPPHMAGYPYGPPPPMAHQGGPHGPHVGGRPQVTKGPDGANLFVYGIPESYSDSDLSNMFISFGTVINAKVYRDLSTGKSKGFGFVSFDSVGPAQHACASLDGVIVAGKKMTVKPKSEVQNQQQQQQQHHHQQQQQHGGQQFQSHEPNQRAFHYHHQPHPHTTHQNNGRHHHQQQQQHFQQQQQQQQQQQHLSHQPSYAASAGAQPQSSNAATFPHQPQATAQVAGQ